MATQVIARSPGGAVVAFAAVAALSPVARVVALFFPVHRWRYGLDVLFVALHAGALALALLAAERARLDSPAAWRAVVVTLATATAAWVSFLVVPAAPDVLLAVAFVLERGALAFGVILTARALGARLPRLAVVGFLAYAPLAYLALYAPLARALAPRLGWHPVLVVDVLDVLVLTGFIGLVLVAHARAGATSPSLARAALAVGIVGLVLALNGLLRAYALPLPLGRVSLSEFGVVAHAALGVAQLLAVLALAFAAPAAGARGA